jgi:hypothetical protein
MGRTEYILLGADGRYRGPNDTRVRRERATGYSEAAAVWLQKADGEKLIVRPVEQAEPGTPLSKRGAEVDEWIEASPDLAVALTKLAEERLVELEQHHYKEVFDGEGTALRKLGLVLERGRQHGLRVTYRLAQSISSTELEGILAGEISATQWNTAHPVGTKVVYYPVVKLGKPVVGDGCEGQDTETRSEAWMLGDSAVVMVQDRAGCVAVSHLAVRND